MFTPEQLAQFARDGYTIERALAPRALCAQLLSRAEEELAQGRPPLEYEADVGYPGAPTSQTAAGGRTVRRLLQAYDRDAVFQTWARHPDVLARLRQLLGGEIVLPLAHHNCIMTKQPRHSSDTLWHQDIRYWSYTRPDLVSVWLALGEETAANGALRLLPGTHRVEFDAARFDAARFFRPDLADNQALLRSEKVAALHAGDVLFFHARTLHAAGRNTTDATKFSLVFTYRPKDNLPLAGRSAATREVPL